MDIIKFSKILNDKNFYNLNKLKYKYPEDIKEFIKILNNSFYTVLPLKDFKGNNIVYLPSKTNINFNAFKLLYKNQSSAYGIKTLENEIIATSKIENIDFDRKSVRNILKGLAPKDEEENRIYGLKQGYDFISNLDNKINEDNIFKLYSLTINNYLDDDNKLKKGWHYRHDSVFIVGSKLEHIGLDYKKLNTYMKDLINFINTEDEINDLLKASIIHFYIAYLHPYFDGNGRMSRLLHMWYLIQRGYKSTLFISLSSYIEKSRKYYYDAYSLCEDNYKMLDKLDITPFIVYTIDNIYNHLNDSLLNNDTLNIYEEFNNGGEITLKENKLWNFVLSTYGDNYFTTKQLEKDYGDVAYATIYNFVLKFKKLNLLEAKELSNKVLYKIK